MDVDCQDAAQDGPNFTSVAEAETHANSLMKTKGSMRKCIEVDQADRPRPPVLRWVLENGSWERKDVMSVVRIDVAPTQFTSRVAAELTQRLKGTVKEEVKVNAGEIAVISPFDRATLYQSVVDAVKGIRQIFALDPLDEGLKKVQITVR
jgi:hypothetical protein